MRRTYVATAFCIAFLSPQAASASAAAAAAAMVAPYDNGEPSWVKPETRLEHVGGDYLVMTTKGTDSIGGIVNLNIQYNDDGMPCGSADLTVELSYKVNVVGLPDRCGTEALVQVKSFTRAPVSPAVLRVELGHPQPGHPDDQ